MTTTNKADEKRFNETLQRMLKTPPAALKGVKKKELSKTSQKIRSKTAHS